MGSLTDLDLVALLEESVRRRLYLHVRDRREPVGRDEAARAVGISRSLAAFHLDRLAEAGLLDVEFRRLTGRTGRGAGRPAKLYRVSDRRVEVSVPDTRYEVAGRILLSALDRRRPSESAAAAARRAGRDHGRSVASALASGGEGTATAYRTLEELGFEPERQGGDIRLRNCPFHDLVSFRRDLVCAMNHGFVSGLLSGLAEEGLHAEPRQEPGYCCVVIRERGA